MKDERKSSQSKGGQLTQRLTKSALVLLFSPIRLFKVACFSLGLSMMLTGLVLAYFVWGFLRTVPSVDGLTFSNLQLQATQRAYAQMQDKKKGFRWTPLNEVSREYLYSIVLSEDSTFFEHGGFNFEMIANSLAENIREKKPAFGASTISQQVVKNLFLDNEKTVSRKLREFLVTRDLEKHFTKNQILELYLNVAEFGPDIVGVDSASRFYFHKNPSDINAAEGGFIALMLPSPKRNHYSIYKNHNLTRVKKRRVERVLRDMLYEEFITEKQYRQYVHYNYFPETWRQPARER